VVGGGIGLNELGEGMLGYLNNTVFALFDVHDRQTHIIGWGEVKI